MTPGVKTWTADKWCKGRIHGQSDNISSSAHTLLQRCVYNCIYYSSPCLSHSELPDYSHASPWSLIGYFFISMAKQELISYIRVLSSGCVNLYYMLNEIFLQSQLTPCTEHRQCSTVSLASVHTSKRTCQLNNHGTSMLYKGRYVLILWANFDYIWQSTIQNYPKTTSKISRSYLHTTPKVGEFKCYFHMIKFNKTKFK